MVNRTSNKNQIYNCFQCGSELIFVSEETVLPEGSRFSQTNTIYRCSNAACQEKKDKEKEDRVKQQQKKTELAKTRLEELQEKRKLSQKSKVKEN